jgi:hypothetical protein
MNDIEKRLRYYQEYKIMLEAADRIDALKAALRDANARIARIDRLSAAIVRNAAVSTE